MEALGERCSLKSMEASEKDIFCQRLDDGKESLIFAFYYGNGEKRGGFSVENIWNGEVSVRELTSGCQVECTCQDGRICFAYEIPAEGTAIFKITEKE